MCRLLLKTQPARTAKGKMRAWRWIPASRPSRSTPIEAVGGCCSGSHGDMGGRWGGGGLEIRNWNDYALPSESCCVKPSLFRPTSSKPHGRAIRCRAKPSTLTLLTIAWFPHKTTQTHLVFICVCVSVFAACQCIKHTTNPTTSNQPFHLYMRYAIAEWAFAYRKHKSRTYLVYLFRFGYSVCTKWWIHKKLQMNLFV